MAFGMLHCVNQETFTGVQKDRRPSSPVFQIIQRKTVTAVQNEVCSLNYLIQKTCNVAPKHYPIVYAIKCTKTLDRKFWGQVFYSPSDNKMLEKRIQNFSGEKAHLNDVDNM
jgi:hypothetical protein